MNNCTKERCPLQGVVECSFEECPYKTEPQMEFIYSIEMINGSFTPVRKEGIVRCKDCAFNGNNRLYGNYVKCCREAIHQPFMELGDFCSKGRKEL